MANQKIAVADDALRLHDHFLPVGLHLSKNLDQSFQAVAPLRAVLLVIRCTALVKAFELLSVEATPVQGFETLGMTSCVIDVAIRLGSVESTVGIFSVLFIDDVGAPVFRYLAADEAE